MIALMYFLMIRPQQKQRKQHDQMVNRMQPGDEVVTIGRLHGIIDSVDTANKTVSLDCDGIYLTFDLNAIASVKKPGQDNNAAAKPAKDSKSAKSDAAKADDKAAAKDDKADDSDDKADSKDDAKKD